MCKLIILVSSSGFDIGILKMKRGWPGRSPSYLNCDTGTALSETPISANRLLCLVKLEDNKKESRINLTGSVGDVLDECHAFDCVVGTHTKTNSPDEVLEVAKLKSKCQAIQNYGTGSPEYGFVKTWCEDLRQDSPSTEMMQKSFDRLYHLLRSNTGPVYIETEPLLRYLSGIRHDLVGLLSPFVTDAEEWVDRSHCGEYLCGIQNRSKGGKEGFLKDARALMYERTFNLVRVAKAVAARLGECDKSPAHIDSDRIQESLTKLQSLLPASDESNALLFTDAMALLDAFGSGNSEVAKLHVEAFLEWQSAFQGALDELAVSESVPKPKKVA